MRLALKIFLSNMTHRIKIVGAVEIEQGLDDKQDYSVVLKRCSIKNTNRTADSGDGYCYTYALESLDVVTILGAGGTVIQGKGKSRSKQMRARLYQLASEQGIDDQENFYQQKMNYIIANLEDILKI
jgi:nitrogen regulatory protein PII